MYTYRSCPVFVLITVGGLCICQGGVVTWVVGEAVIGVGMGWVSVVVVRVIVG